MQAYTISELNDLAPSIIKFAEDRYGNTKSDFRKVLSHPEKSFFSVEYMTIFISDAAKGLRRLADLAHEIFHLLCLPKWDNCTYFEEGMANYFAIEYLCSIDEKQECVENFVEQYEQQVLGEPWYGTAYSLVIDNDMQDKVKGIREYFKNKNFSQVTAKELHLFDNTIDYHLCEQLMAKMP